MTIHFIEELSAVLLNGLCLPIIPKKLPGECPGTLLYLKWLKRKQNIHLAKIHLTKVTKFLQITLVVRLFKLSEDTNSVFIQLFGYSADDEEPKRNFSADELSFHMPKRTFQ
eukprot:GHVP01015417.1.p1 GENE.GHVP01015417.1~~GHVP01015417.1.p1  ORF type:complete len:112 (-),score=14.77 GHVP01015417.1:132-467(-)